MPSALAATVPQHLDDALAQLDPTVIELDRRRELLRRAFELRSGRERTGRFWRVDLDALDYEAPSEPSVPSMTAQAAPGVVVCDLSTGMRTHRALMERVFGRIAAVENEKFAALAAALCNTGAFVYVPRDLAVDAPIEIQYDVRGALFPYTVVLAERGASVTVVERLTGDGVLACGITEVLAEEGAQVTYVVEQALGARARSMSTRCAKPRKDARATWALAELGGALCVGSVGAVIEATGAQVEINALFFPERDQHVDLVSQVDHDMGQSQSETLVKSAAIGRGQARFLGTIRIAPHAQGTQASLRDDALLLSPRAHIDSVPALEIAANDVKAFHGATVGALDEEQIFYMTSRGIAPEDAEKMIALGFFEPVIERFPTNALRERLRRALENKVNDDHLI